MRLCALGQQTLAPVLASSGQRGAATLRLHARAKTVLAFERAL